jgi:hypothetical protein
LTVPALAPVLADRRRLWAFAAGCVAVTIGVVMHLPMFWMGRGNGFRLADMPMDAEMLWGMALIVADLLVAGYGLLPRTVDARLAGPAHDLAITAPEDVPLGPAHWRLMIVLTIALVIDVMKPASLGFVVPGMRSEYAVSSATVAWLPFAALCGTVVGSVLWGWLADLYGRRASILLSAVMFVGTSICGAMPSLWWNVGMCFLMGAAAGGMLPVAYAPSPRPPSKRSAAGRCCWSAAWRGRRLSRGERPLGVAAAAVRLARALVPQPADGADPDLSQRLHPRVAEVPARDRPRRRGPCRAAQLRLHGARRRRGRGRAYRKHARHRRPPAPQPWRTWALSVAASPGA